MRLIACHCVYLIKNLVKLNKEERSSSNKFKHSTQKTGNNVNVSSVFLLVLPICQKVFFELKLSTVRLVFNLAFLCFGLLELCGFKSDFESCSEVQI